MTDSPAIKQIARDISHLMQKDRASRNRLCKFEATNIYAREVEPLEVALKQINTGRCEAFTGESRCQADPARSPDAEFTADKWCNSCIAAAALGLAQGETP